MAGDWIKMRTNLARCPQVVRIASALSADRLRVIGGLHALWSLADEQTEDGVLAGYTTDFVDEMIGWSGFCAALHGVGWLDISDQGITLPRFEEHNGQSAKRRAQEADRKRIRRASASTSASNADKKRTREEKRREDIKTRAQGADPDPAFVEFWKAYPSKVGKGAAEAAWRKAPINGHLPEVLAAIEAQRHSKKWTADGGKYIPNPATWINQRRWEDQLEVQIAPQPRTLAI